MARKGRLERKLDALDAVIGEEPSPARLEALREAIAEGHALVATRAADVVREERIAELEGVLIGAWARFLDNPTKTDPGCHAKVAILSALDHLERIDPEPFVAATSYVQLEGAWGPPDDTAVGVRGRAALALTRIQYSDALPVLGRLLADPEAQVRSVAAQSVAFLGRRDGASLLLLRLAAGEDDPEVVSECLRALCTLAPDLARPVALDMLRSESLRELAAHAVVASERDAALAILIDALPDTVRADVRAVLYTALGVSRRDLARTLLLTTIAEGRPHDAQASVRALGVHAYDPRLAAAVREAAAKNEEAKLGPLVEETFPEAD